ncbi:hypothetical protein CDD82_3936 [Ophiocordyceps australis]|uniref:Carrier domain-containing protein n=1 Tax=Ophiocordyceps australis TaxID=1399860 RepID=A0A2C5ZUA7_9HYPO|nr:hypothetical protein CDD82_3936 [Ophiocordyceps australis]
MPLAEPRTRLGKQEKAADGIHGEPNSISNDDMLSAIDTSAATFLSSESEDGSLLQSSTRQNSQRDSTHQQLQDLLLSTSKVERVLAITPRAGPYEGKLVVLVAPATKPAQGRSELLPDQELRLVPRCEDESGRQLIQELRTVIMEWGGSWPRPDIWVMVQRLACDVRHAQTWVQNMTGHVVERVAAMQQPPPRRSHDGSQGGKKTVDEAEKEGKWKRGERRSRQGQTGQARQPRVNAASAAVAEAEAVDDGEGQGEKDDHRQEQAAAAAAAAAAARRSSQADKQKQDQAHDNDNDNDNDNDDQGFFFPLSPMQQLFFRTTVARSIETPCAAGIGFRFSQSILLRVRGNIPLADIEAAVAHLTARHSMLRAHFRLTPGGWAQTMASAATGRSHRFEHRYAAAESDVLAAMEQARRSLNLFNGPVFAAEHMRTADNSQLLFLVAHHLVVDLASWHILLKDLNILLRDGVIASPPSAPFTHWVDLQSLELQNHPPPSHVLDAPDLDYWHLSGRSNCYGDTEQLNFSLDAHVAAALISRCNEPLRTRPCHILMACLVYSFGQVFSGQPVPIVWNQESARSSSQVQNTIGWFTTLCPVRVHADAETHLVQLVRLVKDAHKAAAQSHNSMFPFAIAHASNASSVPVQVMFNCVETLHQLTPQNALLEPTRSPDRDVETLTCDVGPQVGRISLFEMSVVLDEYSVQVEFVFNAYTAHQDRIITWMNNFERAVAQVTAQLLTMKTELTLADAPLLKTSYETLKTFASYRLPVLGLTSVSNIESIGPVTPLQQEILIAQGQDQNCYSISCTYEFKLPAGLKFNQARLYESWKKLIARHHCLRSIFTDDTIADNGLFVKIILTEISPEMLFLDSPDPDKTLASVPPVKFVPSRPRHRLSVSKSSTRMYIRFDVSQALCDIFTVNSLFSQLEHEYAAGNTHAYHDPFNERPSSLVSSPPVLGAWIANLSGARPCIFPRLVRHEARRLHVQGFNLVTSRLSFQKFCSTHDIEDEAVIKLAWGLVLRCFVAEDKVCFGYQVQRRGQGLLRNGAEPLGCLDAVVACVVDFSNLSNIGQMLWDIQKDSMCSSAQGVPPMSEIEHALGLRGERLFNTSISFGDSARHGLDGKFVSVAFDANCDVSLCVTMVDDKVHCDMTYRGLGAEQAANVMGCFECAIEAIIHDPLQPVSDVDLLTKDSLEQITKPDWNMAPTDGELHACIDEMIMRQAKQRPHERAIVAWDGEFSYRQVDVYVEKLATSLVNLGVRPGILVPVVLDKCRWSPIIMLAVLKAGACFVAIDSQDASSAKTLISQLDAPLVLVTESAWMQTNPLASNCLVIDQAKLDLVPPQLTLGLHKRSPEQAACAFLSPGQSGPKGMFYTHQSLCSIFSVQGPALGIDECSRVLQLSAYNVDVALVEILETLLHGGCVCIPSAHERMNDLQGVMSRMGITWTYMTPVLARKMDPAALPNLGTVCFRTRNLDQLTYSPWLDGREVLLVYGAPDICPLAISISRLSAPVNTDILAPPLLGRFLILNPEDAHKMAPIGAVGELAIDSRLITPHKFVLGEPLVDPASLQEPIGKARWRYLRTSHRAQFLDCGHVRYLGSVRDQAGVNGCAAVISDAERQARLCLQPNQDIMIEPVTTSDAMHLLVAFIDLDGDAGLGSYDLGCLGPEVKNKLFVARRSIELELEKKSKIGKKLPWQCIPAAFVPLRGFPLSASLKVNRRKLHKMVASMSCSQLMGLADGQYSGGPANDLAGQAPCLTAAQESMQRLWAETLDMTAASIRLADSFFDAGGDVWLSAQLAMLCRQNGYDVSVHDIVGGASLLDMCHAVSGAMDGQGVAMASGQGHGDATTPRLREVGSRLGNISYHALIKHVLSPQIGVSWMQVLGAAAVSSQQIACLESSLYARRGDVCCLILDFNGPVMLHRLETACEELTRLHPVLRTVFATHDCRAYQVVIGSLKFKLAHRDCEARHVESAVEHVVREANMLPLHFGSAMTRFTFVGHGQQGKLVLQFSTVQISEACIPQLVHDLVQLYTEPERLSAKPTFLEYCHETRHNALYAEAVQHWRKRLAGASMTNILPNQKPRGPAASMSKLYETVHVSPLADLGIDFETVLKTAWALVLATLAGRDDVVFGHVVGSQRMALMDDKMDVASIVGPMERVVPVRIRFPITQTSPLQMMLQVQRDCLSSRRFEHLESHTIIGQCTDWPRWAGFSSVVCHDAQGPIDGSTTLNLGSTTFTYRLVGPMACASPDMLVCSMPVHPGRVALSLAFPTALVPADFGASTMRLLVGAVKTLTCYETVSESILPPSGEYKALVPRAPLGQGRRADDADEMQQGDSNELNVPRLSHEQHRALGELIAATWRQVLLPQGCGISLDAQEEGACFYDVAGCLLPAYMLSHHLNHGLSRLGMMSFGAITLTPDDIIRHPTMAAQRNLVARKMHKLGLAAPAARRRAFSIMGRGISESAPWPAQHKPSPSLGSWRAQKPRHGSMSMRDLGSRAGDWMRHHVSMSRDKDSKYNLVGGHEQSRLQRHQIQQSSVPLLDDVSPLSSSSPGGAWSNQRAAVSPLCNPCLNHA